MSPTSSPVSSASFPLSTSTQTPHSASATHPNALIVLPISVGVFLLAGAIFLIARLRRSPSVKAASPTSNPFSSTTNLTLNPAPSHGTLITDPSHPAAHITPFGSPADETPRFKRTSSSPMRIAQRLPSGAWHFVDPRAPFAPAGVTELDVPPLRPSSPTTPYSRSRSRKACEANTSINTRDKIGVAHPPPAYSATG